MMVKWSLTAVVERDSSSDITHNAFPGNDIRVYIHVGSKGIFSMFHVTPKSPQNLHKNRLAEVNYLFNKLKKIGQCFTTNKETQTNNES